MIRKVRLNECEVIFSLMGELVHTTLNYTDFQRIYTDLLNNPDCYCIVWEEDNTIMGFLNMKMEHQLHHASKIAEIMELVIASNHRSKGIGKQLFVRACEYAKENHCEQIELSSGQKRTDAHRFYESNGMMKSHYRFTMKLD